MPVIWWSFLVLFLCISQFLLLFPVGWFCWQHILSVFVYVVIYFWSLASFLLRFHWENSFERQGVRSQWRFALRLFIPRVLAGLDLGVAGSWCLSVIPPVRWGPMCLSHPCCLLSYALPGSWKQEQGWGLNPDTSVEGTAIPSSILTAVLDFCPLCLNFRVRVFSYISLVDFFFSSAVLLHCLLIFAVMWAQMYSYCCTHGCKMFSLVFKIS